MKPIATIYLLSLVTGFTYGEGVAPSSSIEVGISLQEKVREEFKFDPRENSNQSSELSPPTKNEKVIELEKYVVRSLSQYKLLELSFLQQEEAFNEKTFTNNSGGTFYETKWGKTNIEFKFKYNPSHNLMDVFKVSW